MNPQFLILTLSSIVAAGTPLIFAGIGETLAEKSGVVNLSLDGTILISALVSFAVSTATGSLLLGVLAAMVVGAMVAYVIALQSISFHQDQITAGYILTLLCGALSSFLGQPYVQKPGPFFARGPIPYLSEMPILGKIFFDQSPFVYFSFFLILVAWGWIEKTRFGLELQAVGEEPEAAFDRGIDVNRLRYLYTVIGGALVGLAGASYSIGISPGWTRGHTLGIGWLALALVIFGGWHPVQVALGAYLFGGLTTAGGIVQRLAPWLPSQLLGGAPFALMIITLLLVRSEALRRRRGAPRALGSPFTKE